MVMKYLINTIGGYYDKIGGSLVLHQLAKQLKEKNQEVYLWCTKTIGNPTLIEESEISKFKDDAWMIYPEVIHGNPYDFKNVVRWVLHTPGYHGGDSDSWGKDDLVYLFCDYFNLKDGVVAEDGYLRIHDFKLDKFTNYNLNARDINCHLFRKHKGVINLDKHSADSVCIDEILNGLQSVDELVGIFNKTNIFVSYDTATYISTIAALCGATSVIIPDGVHTKEEYIKKWPVAKYGIAYGLDDIEWAINTKHLVRDHLLSIERENDMWLDKFIENTTKKFKA